MFQKDQIETNLDDQINKLLEFMDKNEPESSEYATAVDQLTKLYELRNKSRISKETWATIGANLAGIVIILNHERAHVIASKTFGLVKKIF